jgi:uncharacterized protein (TIGR03435 family)
MPAGMKPEDLQQFPQELRTEDVSLFDAFKKQAGLKLEAQKGPVQILVIDKIEKPSEN